MLSEYIKYGGVKVAGVNYAVSISKFSILLLCARTTGLAA